MTCDLCAGTNLLTILEPFPAPLVNDFRLPDEEPAPTYPLGLALCGSCGVLQLTDQLPHDVVFPRDYAFRTGATLEARSHAGEVADVLAKMLPAHGLVLDVGSNDGTLLGALAGVGFSVVGIEPTEAAARTHLPTIHKQWTDLAAEEVLARHGRPAAVTMLNVAAHMPDLPGAFRRAARLLDEDGLLFVEVQRAETLVNHGLYDTIYHEHRVYWSALTLCATVAAAGFRVEALDVVAMHGGSWRLIARKSGWAGVVPEVARTCALWSGPEFGMGLGTLAARVAMLIKQTVDLGAGLDPLVCLGAPSRGVTLLAACGSLGQVAVVLDANDSAKVGRVFPGTKVVVKSERDWDGRTDACLVLAWHLGDRMLRVAKQLGFRRALVPLPEPRMVML